MSLESHLATMRIMGRQMAPMISDTFYKAALVTGKNVFDLYMILRHKPGGNLNDPKDSLIEMRDIKSGDKIELRDDQEKQTDDNKSQLEEFFPILKEIIGGYSDQWNVSSFDLFFMMRLKPNAVQGGANSVNMEIKTRKGIEPPMTDKIV